MLQQLEKLHAECFPHKPWHASDFDDLKKSGCDIIASQNGFIVYRVVADEAEIISIGVAPTARRAGIAAAMLEIAARDTQQRGAKNLFLEVARDNTAALGLYQSAGFSEIGIRPKYYDGVDAILMSRAL